MNYSRELNKQHTDIKKYITVLHCVQKPYYTK